MSGYRYRKGEYVEDSTRGKATARPRAYKGDGLVQAWVDKRKLAMLSEWLDRVGHRTRHLSDVLKCTIDIIVEQLVDNGIIEKIEFTGDAEQILAMKYRAELNPGGRGLRNRVHNLQLDEIRKSNTFEYEVGRPPVRGTVYDEVRDKADNMMKRYRDMQESGELEEKLKDKRKKDTEESIEEQKKEFEYDENGIFVGRKKPLPGSDIIIDVDENMRKAEEADKKLEEM